MFSNHFLVFEKRCSRTKINVCEHIFFVGLQTLFCSRTFFFSRLKQRKQNSWTFIFFGPQTHFCSQAFFLWSANTFLFSYIFSVRETNFCSVQEHFLVCEHLFLVRKHLSVQRTPFWSRTPFFIRKNLFSVLEQLFENKMASVMFSNRPLTTRQAARPERIQCPNNLFENITEAISPEHLILEHLFENIPNFNRTLPNVEILTEHVREQLFSVREQLFENRLCLRTVFLGRGLR